jgi:hypothetical protein
MPRAAVSVDLLAGSATGAAGTDVLSNINEARGSAFNDTLAGSNRTDVTELFEGREGDDVIDGRGGFDIVRFDNATGGVTASLVSGTATGGGIGNDTFTNVEGLWGSIHADVLTGGNAANGTAAATDPAMRGSSSSLWGVVATTPSTAARAMTWSRTRPARWASA